jgi:hypothetical protein
MFVIECDALLRLVRAHWVNRPVVGGDAPQLLEHVGELPRAIVLTTPRRDGIRALPVRHRPRVRILREQSMNEGRARSHPTNEEDRGWDLGAQNLRGLADCPLYRQVLSSHSEAIHPRGDPAREAQHGIFLHRSQQGPERRQGLRPGIPDSRMLALCFGDPGLGRRRSKAR